MDEEEFYSRLKDEIADWQRDGVIDSIQAEAIIKRYGIEKKGYRAGRVITAISIIGSVLVGAGVLLFIASNWEKIPAFGKVLILMITTFSTYFAGYVMRFEKNTYPRVGHALLLLASILVGATIFLVGQIFNINVDTHWLVLLWFIAISPMGYVFESRPTIALNILTFALWMNIFINRGSYMGMYTPLLYYMLFGIALYSTGQMHELIDRWSGFRMVYKGFGIFFILLSYFYFSIWPFSYYYGEQPKLAATAQLLMGFFAVLAIVSILANLFKKERLKSTRYEFYVLLAAFAGWIFLFIINSYPHLFYKEATGYGGLQISPNIRNILFVIFNLFHLGISIGTISIGYYKNEAPFVNTGILFFALGVMQVYINHLMGMLPMGVGLIIGGILLILVAIYLEKKRKELITAMRGSA